VISLMLAASFVGCDYERMITKAPPGATKTDGPVTVGKFKLRERVPILPGTISWPPPAEPGIYASQCADLADGGAVSADGCITGVISCGETIIGHTLGGVNRYDTKFYEKHFCTPGTTDHSGGDERIYRLDVPAGDHIAVVTMDSPCADLDLAGFKWKDKTCPQTNHLFDYCEMWPKPGHSREKVRLVSQGNGTSFYIVVEGKGNEEGAFSLTTQCRAALW
jgi:hypothetical protein